jgi:hypothetical protein
MEAHEASVSIAATSTRTFTRVASHCANMHEPLAREPLARSLGTLVVASSLSFILPQARGLRHQSSSWCPWLSHGQTPTPHPPLPEASGFRWGSLPSFPLPLPSCWQLPVFVMEDANGMREVACASRPHPRSAAPQSLSRVRQVDLECQSTTSPCSGPSSGVAPTMSGMTGWHLRQGMPGAPFPVGLDTLHVIHRVIPQPSHHLLRAGLPRMGPFRSMLLTP